MKAIRKSDGKVIEVEQATAYDGEIGYWDYENCDSHYPSELDFNVEESEEVTIDGWVARDEDGDIYVYKGKPTKEEDYWLDDDAASIVLLPITYFPSLTWESDPLEVTITIKPKKQ